MRAPASRLFVWRERWTCTWRIECYVFSDCDTLTDNAAVEFEDMDSLCYAPTELKFTSRKKKTHPVRSEISIWSETKIDGDSSAWIANSK